MSLAVLAVIKWGIPGECALSRQKRPGTLEIICYSLALILIMAGLTIVTSLPGFTAFLAGSVLLALLVRHSRRVESPVLDIGLFQNDLRFSTANLAILVFNTGGFAVIFLLSLFLQSIQGYDARFAGLILIILLPSWRLHLLEESSQTASIPGSWRLQVPYCRPQGWAS